MMGDASYDVEIGITHHRIWVREPLYDGRPKNVLVEVPGFGTMAPYEGERLVLALEQAIADAKRKQDEYDEKIRCRKAQSGGTES
jgi:hypothetical protein